MVKKTASGCGGWVCRTCDLCSGSPDETRPGDHCVIRCTGKPPCVRCVHGIERAFRLTGKLGGIRHLPTPYLEEALEDLKVKHQAAAASAGREGA